ncbi:isocitrate lyase/phosphoenolpyruvate mutase family protein [Flavobacterium sp. CBA20B-1]|uniref:isocitrate lyase/PEP mutase family protein n=1 Tax=unclassified Flavobacterium TaxID=196869 RepID=UPI0022245D44|nr:MULTISPECIES: isocitrate lyase/phosphoenolpyruvate mutase family protein [unclassified Flavobacterium]WCM40811.1 isocitrate lyase/phosphoenolpyruvate mutase family protein [Flavobacterium sp. CBA20B-1]
MSLEKFKSLHHQNQPLLIANTWDAISSKAAEKAGFQIIGTSSHAIANILGYEDGENIPFEEMFFMVEKIAKSTSLLVSADFESGYSDDPQQVAKNVEKLVDAGVLGINLEDGLTNGKDRSLGAISILTDKIKAIKSHIQSKGKDIYINARIDTYTTKHPDAINETLKRIKAYESAGADGFFIPLINTDEDIKAVLQTTQLPLNVFMKDGLKTYEEFAELGVHRVSYGNGIHAKITEATNKAFDDLMKTKSLK